VGVISGAGGGLGASGGTATGPTGGGIATTTGGLAGCWGGVVVQAASKKATLAREAGTLRRIDSIRTSMWILLLEAGGALAVLIFLVWWTMFSGRNDAEPNDAARKENDTPGP
jgi:hypothetical protein